MSSEVLRAALSASTSTLLVPEISSVALQQCGANLQVRSRTQGLQTQALPRQVLISAEQIQLQTSRERVARFKAVLSLSSPTS